MRSITAGRGNGMAFAIIHTRPSVIREDPQTHNLIIRYVNGAEGSKGAEEQAGDTRSAICEEEFDLVVLSVGMEVPASVRDLGRRLGVEVDDAGFCRTVPFAPLQTSRPGILALGPFREPKDIPESVVEASGAAGLAGALLALGPLDRDARGGLPAGTGRERGGAAHRRLRLPLRFQYRWRAGCAGGGSVCRRAAGRGPC
jgi:heterodisulfide reductase subunit A-like polyferredoxin